MNLSLFTQFSLMYIFIIPSSLVAVLVPWVFIPNSSLQWDPDRSYSIRKWSMSMLIREIFSPTLLEGHVWTLMFVTLAAYLVFLNLLGLVPYTFSPTSHLSHNLAFAVPFWLVTTIVSIVKNSDRFVAHLLPPGTPTFIIPILVIVESLSLIIRPLALGVRLAANITAGHLLVHLVAKVTFILLTTFEISVVFTAVLLTLLIILEVAVAVIQAYVFILLLSLYLQEND
uniref:ATP synthase subunit a n=3 Tax=Pampus TaxID=163125 RepID=A0A023J846_PAMAR|nr:ATP synthase F0 subunit 6 [Pampus sp. LY-2009]YP_008994367.1 ATP synthase F0 subunit 6 [Pampus echinogaster]YP_009002365.1 ATP synthase F0 subunit 6 [Pampus argenteus]ABY51654.1 ATP synthase F0 subunit 6 [Pampus sp. LY-2009]AGT54898.1 ATP synthase F0 subunit 6 [Pampus echinogaster]AHH24433.1 ATP synthase F0 subunit 6 [Pampus argenteus]WAJ58214.1 ATP synthase F0 subunit 6 [Pampus argenteus]WAJ58227.1 ATP synthase F0 subunit 6 [Pampus argenteus]